MNNKIFYPDILKKILIKKIKNKKVVLCHGVFDLLHFGHIKHFEEAKNYGDILVVSITPDKFVNKGPSRPMFKEDIRMKSLAALEIVDYVTINDSVSAVNIIKKLKPNFYCKGPDYKDHKKDVTKNINKEKEAIKSCKGKIVYTSGETFSSGSIINKYSDKLDTDTKKNILKIKDQLSIINIQNIFKKINKLKILVIGELMIDEYTFSDALGKSGKDPILVLKEMKTEKYLGGAGSIARNLTPFSKDINLITMLGEKSEYKDFIKKNLNKSKMFYIKKKNSPTIVKKRFLDIYSNSKVLGLYQFNDDKLNKKNEKELQRVISKKIVDCDLVIVSDYGHGFISENTAKLITKKAKFLALNAQINAANIGLHSLNKYQKVDCIIINEKELKHEFRDKNSGIKPLMKKLSKLRKAKKLIVTQGKSGSILYDKTKNSFFKIQGFADSALDKIGAGDTMLTLLSLCFRVGLNNFLSLLIGSIGAAESVKNFGNKEMINKTQIIKTLENISK